MSSTEELDQLITTLVSLAERPSQLPQRVTEEQLGKLCDRACVVLMNQAVSLRLQPPINIVGDIHGQVSAF